MSDKDNLNQFISTIKRAYKHAKQLGDIPATDISIYDKLIECPAVVAPSGEGFGGRPVYVHRLWRRKVARLYHREHPLGEGAWDISWTAIMDFLLENILPILKLLIVIVPLILI